MSITIHIFYSGEPGAAKQFAKEMIETGTVDAIKKEPGNLRYDYFYPMDDPSTVLLIDSWDCQESIDIHHHSPMMQTIMQLREKYNLHMQVERLTSDEEIPSSDQQYIRN